MNVKNEIRPVEINGKDPRSLGTPDDRRLIVESHSGSTDYVHVKFADLNILVVAEDLERAIKNARNQECAESSLLTMAKTSPITPDEVVSTKTADLPDEVIQIFNTEIARSWNGRSAVVSVDTVKESFREAGLDVIDSRWLDIEPVYRAAGWNVSVDFPGYNENYYPTVYTFTRAVPPPRGL